jgi:hypothetical protein
MSEKKSASKQIKNAWRKANSLDSLKTFAKSLLKDNDGLSDIIIEWFANKDGDKDQKRSDVAIKRIIEQKNATKASRRGSGK